LCDAPWRRSTPGIWKPCVIDASRNVFNPNTYTGLDGVREWRAETDEIWEEMRLLPMEFHRRR